MLAGIFLTSSCLLLILGFPTISNGLPFPPNRDLNEGNSTTSPLLLDQILSSDLLSDPETIAKLQEIKALIAAGRLRQDEGEIGLEVGQNVGEIISGVLGAGISNVFSGTSNFIGNANVREEVDFVLNNVSPTLDAVVKFGWQGLKYAFGLTTTSTTTPSSDKENLDAETTLKPQLTPEEQEVLLQQQLIQQVQLLQLQLELQKLQQIQKQQLLQSKPAVGSAVSVAVTPAPPVVFEAVKSNNEDDEELRTHVN